MSAIKVSIIGGPHSGKTTLSAQLHAALKSKSKSSALLEEYAVEYISLNGNPDSLEDQMVIFNEQYERERMFDNKRDFIICDSASWTSYIYGKKHCDFPLTEKQLTSISQFYKKALKSLGYWDIILYVPVLDNYEVDGVRYHTSEEAKKISKSLKNFLDIEGVKYINLCDVKLDERFDYALNYVEMLEEEKN